MVSGVRPICADGQQHRQHLVRGGAGLLGPLHWVEQGLCEEPG